MRKKVSQVSDVSALDSHAGFWLRYVSNHVSQSFARRLLESGVTVAECVVLRSLYDVQAVSSSALADAIGMTRGGVSKLVDRLLTKGLLTRAGRSDDRRFQDVELTDAGRQLVPVLAAIADENDAEFFALLSESDRHKLVGILKQLVKSKGLQKLPTD